MEPTFDLQVIITSGLRDLPRAVLGFASALAGTASGDQVVVFLTMEGAVWAAEGEGNTVQVPGFEPIADYIRMLIDAGAQIEACSSCLDNFCLPLKQPKGKMRDNIVLKGLSTAIFRTKETPTLTF